MLLTIILFFSIMVPVSFSEISDNLSVDSSNTNNFSIVSGLGGATIGGPCNSTADCGGIWNNWYRCAKDYDLSYNGSQGSCEMLNSTWCRYGNSLKEHNYKFCYNDDSYTCSNGDWSSAECGNEGCNSGTGECNPGSDSPGGTASVPTRVYSVVITAKPSTVNITQGSGRAETLTAKNNGDYTLTEVTLVFTGISRDWYSISPSKFSSVTTNQSKTFTLTFTIPENATIFTYNITATVSTNSSASASANFLLNVLPSEKTINETILPNYARYVSMLTELEDNITQLQSVGIDVSELLAQLDFIKEKLNQTNASLGQSDYANAYQLLENAENLISDLQMKIQNARAGSVDFNLIMIVAAVIVVIAVVAYLFLPTKAKSFIPKNAWKPKKIIKKISQKKKYSYSS